MRLAASVAALLALAGCRATIPHLVTDVHYEVGTGCGGGYVVTTCDLRMHAFPWQDDALVNCYTGPLRVMR